MIGVRLVAFLLAAALPSTGIPALTAGDESANKVGTIIADPSYINPSSDPGTWNRLIASPSDKVGVTVANVMNGPGSYPDGSWADVIDRTAASGKRILGYVDTGYLGQTGMRTRLGSASPADWVVQAERDVDAWYDFYGGNGSMGGIFLDDGFNACGAGDTFPAIYQEINQYVKVHHPGAMTVLNPGTVVPRCYEDSADVLLTFEGGYATYEGSGYQRLDWTPTNASKIWHIIYDVPASQVAQVTAEAAARGAGYVYVTDDVLANPYDTIPSDAYWSAEQGAVSGGVPAAAPPVPYVAGSAPPGVPANLVLTASDYTSASLTWTGAANALRYQVYMNGRVVAGLPASMTAVTIGGLTPGASYRIWVTAQGASGAQSPATNTVGVAALSLPGDDPIANITVTSTATTATYTADFLLPGAFRRILIGCYAMRPCSYSGPHWSINYNEYSGFNAYYVLENTTFLSYAGTGTDWSWTPLAYVPPTITGRYTYSWTVPIGTSTGQVDQFVVQTEGYAPLTSVFKPCSALLSSPSGANRFCAE